MAALEGHTPPPTSSPKASDLPSPIKLAPLDLDSLDQAIEGGMLNGEERTSAEVLFGAKRVPYEGRLQKVVSNCLSALTITKTS